MIQTGTMLDNPCPCFRFPWFIRQKEKLFRILNLVFLRELLLLICWSFFKPQIRKCLHLLLLTFWTFYCTLFNFCILYEEEWGYFENPSPFTPIFFSFSKIIWRLSTTLSYVNYNFKFCLSFVFVALSVLFSLSVFLSICPSVIRSFFVCFFIMFLFLALLLYICLLICQFCRNYFCFLSLSFSLVSFLVLIFQNFNSKKKELHLICRYENLCFYFQFSSQAFSKILNFWMAGWSVKYF